MRFSRQCRKNLGKESSWREIWSGSAVKKEDEMVLQVTRSEPD